MKKRFFVIVHETQVRFLDNESMISPVTNQPVSCHLVEFDSDPKIFGDGWDWLIFDYDTGLYVDAAHTYKVAKESIIGVGFELLYKDLVNAKAYDYALKVVGY